MQKAKFISDTTNQSRKSNHRRRKNVWKHASTTRSPAEQTPTHREAPPSPEHAEKLPHTTPDDAEEFDSITDNRAVRAPAETSSVASGSGHRETEEAEEDLVMKRLDALDLSTADIHLSDLQQNINRQEQSDEVLALQAIFREDFVTLEANEGSAQAFMVSIHVEVPTSLDVTMRLPNDKNRLPKDGPSHDVQAEASNTDGKIYACTLQFLPPVHLIFRLLPSYPSHCPPNFILSARWLSKDALSNLCRALDALWEKQAGDVVIYSWVEWLRASCLSHLGITSELELDSGHESKSQDDRGLSRRFTPDTVIPLLIRYNEDRKIDSFLKSLHTCFICFTEQLGKNFVRLPCRHIFCGGCMKQYASINVKEGTVKRLKCPDTMCKGSIPPTILKQLLEDHEFIRWETLLLQKTLDSMVDVVYCPRCEVVCIEDDDHYVQCAGCLFSFCSLCRGPRHVGQECMSAESRLHIIQERQQGMKSGTDRRKKEQNYLNELLNLKYMKEEAKQCPTCKMAISKGEGCNKVTCGNCGQYFCYQCNKAIKGYEHFREGCVLFDDEEIQRWEMAINVGQGPGHEARGDIHGRPCPNCRQGNFKEGNNNHILCWSCQQHFCALCKKMVRRSSEHYGPGPSKCKQHTAD